MTERGLSTAGLVARLHRSGLKGTAGTLRADVHRGLLSQGMPDDLGPGRGRNAVWTAAAVRRALFVARLRRLGVDGRVLPLLAFIRDGWGWATILPKVQRAAARSWELDRRSLNRPTRVQAVVDLLDNADTGRADSGPFDWTTETLPARQFLATAVWTGRPAAGTTMIPASLALLRTVAGSAELDVGGMTAAGEAIEARRRELALPARDVPTWLAALDPAAVARGRRVFRAQAQAYRRLVRQQGRTGSANPLSMFGESRRGLARWLRQQKGRPTASLLLAGRISEAMFAGALLLDDEIPDW